MFDYGGNRIASPPLAAHPPLLLFTLRSGASLSSSSELIMPASDLLSCCIFFSNFRQVIRERPVLGPRGAETGTLMHSFPLD